ncbi:MAG: Holliday junction resolvase RuvX [Candidatus Daviesbacteria bacterium]|nr:Holliday junction resolvase RuvX [Candidatus Daviesbacteria bacterium]
MRYLGVDWGLKKIGIAVSEGELATPLKTLNVKSLDDAIAQVVECVEDEIADLIILGQPEGEMGEIVKKVAKRLKGEGFDVKLTDETLSTQDAKSLLIEMGLGKKDRKEDNATAAAIILQRYLDEKH